MSRFGMLALTAAVSVSASLIAAPMASASAPAALPKQTTSRRGETAANKTLVTAFFDGLFNKHDLSVVDAYISADTYIQHNPGLADGREAFRVLAAQVAGNPQVHADIAKVVAQGDLVLIYSNSRFGPGLGNSGTDTFRVSHGKLVEHWDTVQPVPASTVSGNDMFSTLSGPSTPGSSRLTNVNKRIVTDYFTRLNKRHDLRAIDRYLAPSLFQHDPTLANGSAATKASYATRFAAFPQSTASEAITIAEGDLVTVRYHSQTSATDLGQAVSEIFRVQHGKIVEHWTARQNVPATSANNNTMF
jgi:predicted SnoaL-like aldol condensation-catalyzing enzyme